MLSDNSFFIFSIYLYQFDKTNKKIMIVSYQNNIEIKVGHNLGHTTLGAPPDCSV